MKLHNLKHTCIIPVLCAALLIPSYTVHADWEYNAEENTLRYKTKDGTYLTSVFRKIKGYTYYFNADGTVHTGWLDLKGDRYFFSESGAMLTSQWIGDKYLMKKWQDGQKPLGGQPQCLRQQKIGFLAWQSAKNYKAKFIKTAPPGHKIPECGWHLLCKDLAEHQRILVLLLFDRIHGNKCPAWRVLRR